MNKTKILEELLISVAIIGAFVGFYVVTYQSEYIDPHPIVETTFVMLFYNNITKITTYVENCVISISSNRSLMSNYLVWITETFNRDITVYNLEGGYNYNVTMIKPFSNNWTNVYIPPIQSHIYYTNRFGSFKILYGRWMVALIINGD